MMKNYRHMMEQVTLSDEKKEEILEMLENNQAKRRSMPAVKNLVLAAALAALCVLCMAAGLPGRVFNLAVGGTTVYADPTGTHIDGDLERSSPLVEEDGRLWLTIRDEQRIDVTDLINVQTPYIYDNTDPETGYRDYLIVGGTPTDYGWYECFEIEKDRFGACGSNRHNIYCTIDGVSYDYSELTEEQRNCVDPDSFSEVYKPWFETAARQLDELGIHIM